ncbi:MAG: hypothetical protein K0Q95_2810 [Bacteroidota bacterium]|jgi:hypothetical protein|nr:hypothetical protein [Bacteroidota bacterium]
MKKVAIILFAALTCGFMSCRKDRVCTCTYNKVGSSSIETQITTYDKVTKKSALATCSSGTSYNQSDPSNTETRTCTLK